MDPVGVFELLANEIERLATENKGDEGQKAAHSNPGFAEEEVHQDTHTVTAGRRHTICGSGHIGELDAQPFDSLKTALSSPAVAVMHPPQAAAPIPGSCTHPRQPAGPHSASSMQHRRVSHGDPFEKLMKAMVPLRASLSMDLLPSRERARRGSHASTEPADRIVAWAADVVAGRQQGSRPQLNVVVSAEQLRQGDMFQQEGAGASGATPSSPRSFCTSALPSTGPVAAPDKRTSFAARVAAAAPRSHPGASSLSCATHAVARLSEFLDSCPHPQGTDSGCMINHHSPHSTPQRGVGPLSVELPSPTLSRQSSPTATPPSTPRCGQHSQLHAPPLLYSAGCHELPVALPCYHPASLGSSCSVMAANMPAGSLSACP